MTFKQLIIKSAAVSSGSFATVLQFESLEIHKVCLRLPNFNLGQNLSLVILADLLISCFFYTLYPERV